MENGIVKLDIKHSFKISKRCKCKFDCLLYEMLFFLSQTSSIFNTQDGSI